MAPNPARQAFHLVRGPGRDERFDTIHDLARRIHALRAEREIHLLDQAIGQITGPGEGAAADCVTVRAGEHREALIGYALFPDHPAYQGEAARLRLVKALLDQRPDEARGFDGERVSFSGKAA